MIRIYLMIALIILIFWGLRKFLKTPPQDIAKFVKKTGIYFVVAVFILLALTGKLNILFALLSVLAAFVIRMLPALLRYMPQILHLWGTYTKNKTQQSSHSSRDARHGKAMSKAEAYEVLGLDSSATEQDIILAHRQLIQKMHPDRGGSDYIAAKINLAKKVLLKK